MKTRLKKALDRAISAILPNRCLLCHQLVTGCRTGICNYCLPTCLYSTPVCLGCGKPMTIVQCYCGQCMKREPLKVIAACSYHQGLGPWIAAIKYQRQFAVLPPLIDALACRIKSLVSRGTIQMPQALLAVPLHSNRLHQRGFNQAVVIAKSLSKQIGIPLVEGVIKREKDTPAQAGMSGRQRRLNLRQAFSVQLSLPLQRVALIDDVVTTGTTVSEIHKLLAAQSIDVQIWCLARAEAPHISQE